MMFPPSLITIGIDSSITGTGLAVVHVQGGFLGYQYTKTIKTKLDKKEVLRGRRHRDIWDDIDSTLDQIDFGPYDQVIVVIEHFSMGSKGRVCDLAELIGFIKANLLMREPALFCRIFEVPPTTLKKFTTGYGFADKSQMAQFAESKYGRKFQDDNQCDAYCLAMLGKHMFYAPTNDNIRQILWKKVTEF